MLSLLQRRTASWNESYRLTEASERARVCVCVWSFKHIPTLAYSMNQCNQIPVGVNAMSLLGQQQNMLLILMSANEKPAVIVISSGSSIWAVSCGSPSSQWSEQPFKTYIMSMLRAYFAHSSQPNINIYIWWSVPWLLTPDPAYAARRWSTRHIVRAEEKSEKEGDWRSPKFRTPEKTCPHILNPFERGAFKSAPVCLCMSCGH